MNAASLTPIHTLTILQDWWSVSQKRPMHQASHQETLWKNEFSLCEIMFIIGSCKIVVKETYIGISEYLLFA